MWEQFFFQAQLWLQYKKENGSHVFQWKFNMKPFSQMKIWNVSIIIEQINKVTTIMLRFESHKNNICLTQLKIIRVVCFIA